MNNQGNTFLITGGGSGIGRGLAEAFHQLGNHVIIAGRRADVLREVTDANPGMHAIELDIENPDTIAAFALRVRTEFPAVNVLINNAGIMRPETAAAAPGYLADAEAMIVTNLLGPIRLTAALLPHFLAQPRAAVMMVSSGLAFVPLAAFPTYCATKAAIHSYAVSLRHQLRETAVKVIEIAPPYVQTHLMGEHQASDPNAMPLQDFISEAMDILGQGPADGEVIVGRCKPLRFASENGSMAGMFAMLNPA